MKYGKLLVVLSILLVGFNISCKEKNDPTPPIEPVNVGVAGAQGCGRLATGGISGSIYKVSTLEDNVATVGSLRYILNQAGPKVVLFNVSGTIKLKQSLKIPSNTTIYGQSAPGDGICITGFPVEVGGDNVILQFLRFRMGNTDYDGDALTCIGHKNVLIDHCTFSWSTDECLSCYGNQNTTVQWCMIYEGVNSCNAKEGSGHGFGGIWGGTNATFHHNLIANQQNRCPRFDHDYVSTERGPVDFVNNVVYITSSGNGTYGGESCNSQNLYRKINMINNYYKYSSTAGGSANRILDPSLSCSNCTDKMHCSTIVPGHFYISGNIVGEDSEKSADNWLAVRNASKVTPETSPFAMAIEIEKDAAASVYESVLTKAGASYKRDAADTRVVGQVRNNTGAVMQKFDDIVWPTYNSEEPLKDSDMDGLPNDWEDANGLDKYDWTDSKKISSSGRTYLEEYFYSIVKDLY